MRVYNETCSALWSIQTVSVLLPRGIDYTYSVYIAFVKNKYFFQALILNLKK